MGRGLPGVSAEDLTQPHGPATSFTSEQVGDMILIPLETGLALLDVSLVYVVVDGTKKPALYSKYNVCDGLRILRTSAYGMLVIS